MQNNSQKQVQELTALVQQLMQQNKELMEKVCSQAQDNATGKVIPEKENNIKVNGIARVNKGRQQPSNGKGKTLAIPEKRVKLESMEEFPAIVPSTQSYKQKLQSDKKDYSYIVKQYMGNFLKIANKLNTDPSNLVYNKEELVGGYTTFPQEKLNVLTALPGCNRNLVKAAYDYGLLYSIYTVDGKECSSIPELYQVIKSYKSVTKADMLFVRVYSSMSEVTFDDIIQVTRFIKIGVTRTFILPEPEEGTKREEIIINDVPELFTRKRSWQLMQLTTQLKRVVDTPFWVNYKDLNTIITTNANSYGNDAIPTIEKLYWSLMKPEEFHTKLLPSKILTEQGEKKLCKIMRSNEDHYCKYCSKTELLVPSIDFEDKPETSTTNTDKVMATKESIL